MKDVYLFQRNTTYLRLIFTEEDIMIGTVDTNLRFKWYKYITNISTYFYYPYEGPTNH